MSEGAWDGDDPYSYEVDLPDATPVTLEDVQFWTAPRGWVVLADAEWASVVEVIGEDGCSRALESTVIGRLDTTDSIWYYVDPFTVQYFVDDDGCTCPACDDSDWDLGGDNDWNQDDQD